jgi:hypothetical protein
VARIKETKIWLWFPYAAPQPGECNVFRQYGIVGRNRRIFDAILLKAIFVAVPLLSLLRLAREGGWLRNMLPARMLNLAHTVLTEGIY